jgi:hypothetical protein
VQLESAPILNDIVRAIAALLVSLDFSKPSQQQRLRNPGPGTAVPAEHSLDADDLDESLPVAFSSSSMTIGMAAMMASRAEP